MANKRVNLPPSSSQWVDEKGIPTIPFSQAMKALADNINATLPAAVNDAAAAKLGVAIGGQYLAIKTRIT
jgi:hypothetical protein